MTEWEAPTVTDVARYLPNRAKNPRGVVQFDDESLRTFNDVTIPTETEVESQIADSKTIVESDVGTEFCDKPEAAGFPVKSTSLTAIHAAAMIELGFFPEQIERGQSPYKELKTLYDERRKTLRSEVSEVCGDVPGDDDDDPSTGLARLPDYSFEKPVSNIGFGTLW